MAKKTIFVILVLALVTSLVTLSACSSGGGTSGPPGDSKITGEAKAIHKNTSNYPYEVDLVVLSWKISMICPIRLRIRSTRILRPKQMKTSLR